MSKLTDLQERFVEEYLKDSNASQAAIRAGYSEKTAYQSGYRNMKNVEVVNRLNERRKEIEEQLRQQFSMDAVEARKIMFHIMKSKDAPEHVRLAAAKDFLDRAGYKPVEKQDVNQSGDIGIEVKWAD